MCLYHYSETCDNHCNIETCGWKGWCKEICGYTGC